MGIFQMQITSHSSHIKQQPDVLSASGCCFIWDNQKPTLILSVGLASTNPAHTVQAKKSPTACSAVGMVARHWSSQALSMAANQFG